MTGRSARAALPALLLGLVAVRGEEPECAPGWKEHNEVCYWTSKQGTAEQTFIECQLSGGQPVHIHDEAEQNFLQIEFPGSFYIGLRQLDIWKADCTEAWCGWIWHDDHSPLDYKNWASGQPRDSFRNTWPYRDGGREECVVMENPPNGQGGWNDVMCSQWHYRAICSQPKSNLGKPFQKCPPGATLFNGICWAMKPNYFGTIQEARDECNKDSGALAVIRDEMDERFVLFQLAQVQTTKYRKVWVDYTEDGSNGWSWSEESIAWANGSSFELEHYGSGSGEKCTIATWPSWEKYDCEIVDSNYLLKPYSLCTYPSTLVEASCKTTEKQFRDGCYWISQKRLGYRGYDLAASTCVYEGGIVAPIHDAETSVWVYNNLVDPIGEESVFIGLRQNLTHESCEGLDVKAQKTCGWVWEYGRAQATYLPWETGQPDDGFDITDTEDETGFDNCAAIAWRKYGDLPEPGQWEDRHCGTTLRAVCWRKATTWEPLEAKCSPGQLQVRGRCFWLTPRQASWTTAQDMCHQYGATLAKVTDQYEEEQINKEFGDDYRYLWIGLSKFGPEPTYCSVKPESSRHRCNWRWDEDGWEPTINRWGGGIDASGKRQCAVMEAGSYGSWYPQHCLRPRRGLCSIMASPDPTPVCMPGQKYFNKKCFWLTTSELTHQSSEIECSRVGGTLAALMTEAEDDFVSQEFVGYQELPVYIGLKQMAKEECNETELSAKELMECGWVWANMDEEAPWVNWNLGEPNDFPNMITEEGDQDCVVMYPKGQWGDVSCLDKHLALCEKVAVQSAQPQALNRCDEEVDQQERLLAEFKYISVHLRSIQLLTAPAEHGDKLDFLDEVFVGGNDDKIKSRIGSFNDASGESFAITQIPMESDSLEEFRFKGRGQIEYPNPYPKFTIYQGESIDATVAARDFMVADTEGKNRLQYGMFGLMPSGTALNLKVKLEKRDSLVDLLQIALEVAGYDAICLDDVVMMVLTPGAGKLGKRALKKGMKTAMKTKKLSKTSKRRLKEGYKQYKEFKKTDLGEEVIGNLEGEAEGQAQTVVSDVLEKVLGAKYCVDVVGTIEPFANALLGTREALYELQLVMEGDLKNLDLPVTDFKGSSYDGTGDDEDVLLSIDVRNMSADTVTFLGGEGVNMYWIRDAGQAALEEKSRVVHFANFAQEDIIDLSEFGAPWNDFDQVPLREEEDVDEEEYVMGIQLHGLYIRLTLDCAFDLRPSHFIFAKDREAPPDVVGVGQNPPPGGGPDNGSGTITVAWPVVTLGLALALLWP